MSDNFHSLMNQMRDHYKSGAKSAFVIPHPVQPMAAVKASSSASPQPSDEILPSGRSRAEAIVDRSKAEIVDVLNAFARDKDRNGAVSKFRAVGAKEKAEFDKLIDEAFDKTTELGAGKSPEVQQVLSQEVNIVLDTINQILSASIGFIEDAGRKITTGDVAPASIPDAGKFVENGFAPAVKLLSVL
jgi:hypothetical protein